MTRTADTSITSILRFHAVADDAYRALRASNPASLREIVDGAPQLNRLETLPAV